MKLWTASGVALVALIVSLIGYWQSATIDGQWRWLGAIAVAVSAVTAVLCAWYMPLVHRHEWPAAFFVFIAALIAGLTAVLLWAMFIQERLPK